MATKGALATLDTESALAEIASGVLSKQIAVRYGVSAFAVRKRLAKHPDYPQAIKDQAESFIEDAVCEMMHGELSDMVAITRARSKADIAFKYAAARDPANWGQKANLSPVAIQVVIQRDGVASIQSYPQQIDGDLPKKEANSGEDVNNQ